MAFPADPLDVAVDLQISGAWTEITSDVYARDLIRITRGRPNESSQPEPGLCRMTLNNRSGKYSPRNPVSVYYGLIGRNTPIRVSVPGTVSYLAVSADSDKATTPDTAVLDIVGDIDIRIDVTLDDWRTAGARVLAAKYDNSTANRSWILYLVDGIPVLQWSTNGTATTLASADAAPVVPPTGRISLRVTLDVNDGAGGNVATFYTSTSVGGTWTQLGSTVVGVGTTSIFASAAILGVADAATLTTNLAAISGQVHAFQLRNGIGGSVVANPDFTVQASGATSFVDSAGRTWTVGGAAAISNRAIRFRGEVSSWPTRWDVSGKDIYVPIEAAGVLRRLGQGAAPIGSTMRIALTAGDPDNPIIAYWPCEDASGATSIAAGINGVQPMVITGTPSLAAFSGFDCSDPLPVLGATGVITGQVPTYTAPTTSMVRFLMALPAAGATSGQVLCSIATTGTLRSFEVYYSTTASGCIGIRARNSVGTIVSDSGTGTGPTGLNGAITDVSVELAQSGADVIAAADVYILGGTGALGVSINPLTQTVGIVTAVSLGGALADTAIGHVRVQTSADLVPGDSAALTSQLLAYAGESAADRIYRLATEAGLPVTVLDDYTTPTLVGAQRSATFLGLVGDAALADGGILGESRTTGGLYFRDRRSLYNQTPRLALDYTADGELAPGLEPVDDDQATRNDVEVKRTGGSSARATQPSGTLSIADPPNGVGRYDESVTLNVAGDAELPHIAGWRVHLGTADESRYPNVTVNLAAGPHLTSDVLAVDTGDRLTIENSPSWLPPGLIDQLVVGYSEVLGSFTWSVQFNCVPARPWDVAVLGNTTFARLDGTSTLNAGATSTATSLSVATSAGPIWTTTDVPFGIVVAGERMTVTAVTGAASPQTFTVTRSVNGIVKAQSSGAAVHLYQPMTLAL